ncbi:hypothetical protein [Synechococcus sp. CBW1107]|uniref:hypothetical protein n=1 Tax=Synechococcus sp. CBW1107 TaxID=2789857 RepID=UPI002AD4E598|nr:hypothetical protein [Synechococcus sp. CBW1107]CAK6687318.1 hypothetical protein ICNINCKA_00179 [Synechococcus sp. CBW1107]
MPSRHKSRSGSTPAHLLWAVGTSLMPAFINDGVRPPFRPLAAAVVNGQGLVIGHGVSSPEDPLVGVEDALLQAIGKPAGGFGSGTTPLHVTVDQEALLPLVRRLLPGVPAKVGRSAELEELFQALPAMEPAPEVRGILGLTTYLGGDLTAADIGSFFSACADLYRREPWALFADDQCLFQLTSRALGMNQWCGSVLGQAGESYGVLLFESRLDQARFTQLAQSEHNYSELAPGQLPHQRAISFEPLDAISRELATEIERHGWPVAAGDAYPLPLHIDPDFLAVPPCRDELARLEAMARALSRLIDNTPELEDYWHWSGQEPLRRQYRVPVQDRGSVSVSLSLIPPQDEDEEDWHDFM